MELQSIDVDLLPLFGSFIVIVVLGLAVGRIVKYLTDHIRPENAWKEDVLAAGRPIGLLETTIYMFALISGNPAFIGGWLVFKVAAKWENWAHVVRLPELTTSDLMSPEFEARAKFASWLHSRFLIGVLLNIIVSIVGAWCYIQLEKICSGWPL